MQSMQIRKLVGRGSATRKYDLLTVLGTYALSQDRSLQRQVLRLICLLTARYNWQSDQLSVGQAEIARLWSVDPRTVKREMAAFRDMGWLVEKRPAARGRVTLYGLGMARIITDTRGTWEKVGPDLVARMDDNLPEVPGADSGYVMGGGAQGAEVIPFPQSLPDEPAAQLWADMARQLHAENAGTYQAWFAALRPAEQPGYLVLHAPGGYHATYIRTHLMARLEAALARVAPGLGVMIAG
ncbi:conserved hypothetical protein (plasmid) [Ketogulonicigenium vulgare Y25]|uniref:DnaA N-terminal domain-containing protein n=1 Tax=Ketogulonicigenium vulgare (strain WSH-001) TaxID=759362 RepID=F9YBD1_KETVW|nr:hypothetical protein [Ketogulonicigenium vulgare]ADO44246.1 conserved hypothetical protein [Ketogulonicigenium vulgare Y25]AEM42683.1 hypothetical protein KVU_PB0005 [Ketogulonicigenium vulgare WSH-001]ALJ82865.1 hypothetical protein KVH_16340 [Ketogulonicigenium vulgare]